jgi:glycerol-3-phosphate acyltransferase PlsY
VAVLDISKGLLPALLGRLIGLTPPELSVVALAAVLGHDFSLFLRFRGGKGVATTFGVALVLSPVPTALAMVTWLATWLVWRYASLASLVALAALPLFMAFGGRPAPYVVLAATLFVLGAARHWENIIRLARGKEPKTGERWPRNGESA